MRILSHDFYNRDTIQVAKDLLGKKLVRRFKDRNLSGMVVETEAYLGSTDSASHAYKGQTPRNSVMFGPAGRAYVYFVYGMHYMLNIVTQDEGTPCAILIRAIEPLEGLRQMQALRKKTGKDLVNGPAKLCQAMAIDKSLNGWDLTCGKTLWIEDYKTIPEAHVCVGSRIGIDYAAPKDRKANLRFLLETDLNNGP
ncbi:MAG: DNA-3-methyladenine glycosylase [Desulfobacterales bacterium]|nr:MAG: DNA-3-methyladenine glycosylase [Desulfobacterales bacterium]